MGWLALFPLAWEICHYGPSQCSAWSVIFSGWTASGSSRENCSWQFLKISFGLRSCCKPIFLSHPWALLCLLLLPSRVGGTAVRAVWALGMADRSWYCDSLLSCQAWGDELFFFASFAHHSMCFPRKITGYCIFNITQVNTCNKLIGSCIWYTDKSSYRQETWK